MKRTVTVFRFRKDKPIPDFDVIEVETLEAAISYGEALIVRNGYTHVEIVDGEATIRVTRPA